MLGNYAGRLERTGGEQKKRQRERGGESNAVRGGLKTRVRKIKS